MATGTFDSRGCPQIEVTIFGPKDSRPVTALIDTGFSGNLSTPQADLTEVGLSRDATTKIILADNRTIDADICVGQAQIETVKQECMFVIAPTGAGALLGMMCILMFKKCLVVDPFRDIVELA